MNKSKFIGIIKLFRPELPISAGICVVAGELLALGALPTLNDLLLGFFSVFFISASALILNDYFDIESDRINTPHRPLPSGLVTPRDVVTLAVIVSLLGLVLAYLINYTALVIAAILWLIGFLYNWKLKLTGLFGNLLVSISVGMTFIFGGIVVGNVNGIVIFFAILAALVDLAEEIGNDAMDLEGDKKVNSKSLAVIYGRNKVLKISIAIFYLIVAFTVFPFIFNMLSLIYIIPLLSMDVIIIYAASQLLKAETEKGRKYLRIIYLYASAIIFVIIIMRVVEF